MCADIVIIGGGPIGCWVALQAKKRDPSLNVQIYERYPEYQRDHMMSIKKSSFLRYSKKAGDNSETELYQRISNASSDAMDALEPSARLREVTHIRTLSLEQILKDHCEELGIGFCYEKINSPEDAMERHPECDRFVAADGARSLMRKALLGEDDLYEKDLLYSVDVKYDVRGQAEYLREPTYDKLDMIVVETVGKEKDGITNVGLRFLVDQEIYENLPEATFKKPLSRDDIHPSSKLSGQLRRMQELRAEYTHEERVQDSEKITKIRLSQYASKKFAVTVDSQNRRVGWFMAGDAAMGMPFYRSINSGLMLGSQLGKVLANPQFSVNLQTTAYNCVRPFKLAREFGAVAAKLSGIRAYQKIGRPVLRTLAIAGLVTIAVPIVIPTLILAKLGVIRLM